MAKPNKLTKDPHVHLGGTEGLNGWYVSNVTITMDGSYWYQMDNGSWVMYTAPFTISHDGQHFLNVTDNSTGKWTEEYKMNIDKTPPAIERFE